MKYKSITTLAAVHAALNLDETTSLPNTSGMPEDEAKDCINSILYKRMVRAINQDDDGKDWEPNYHTGETGVQPYHVVSASEERPGGFAFSRSSCVFWLSDACVGSRHCFRDMARYHHALKHFPQLFLETQLILK